MAMNRSSRPNIYEVDIECLTSRFFQYYLYPGGRYEFVGIDIPELPEILEIAEEYPLFNVIRDYIIAAASPIVVQNDIETVRQIFYATRTFMFANNITRQNINDPDLIILFKLQVLK